MIRPLTLYITFFACLLARTSQAQEQATQYQQELATFQEELNREYADTATSPLPKHEIESFSGLPFFPIDSAYRVQARFVRTPGQLPFYMPTTSGQRKVYEKFGELYFTLQGKQHMLPVYQSHALRETEEYKDYLFLPFTDPTNGTETYGSGRYIDLRIPAGDTVTLDFNKAYNPYCAYNSGYACPIPPKENKLQVPVRAGVRAPTATH